MHLNINFHRLALTRGSYIELPKWIKSKKAAINPQNKDEECFKWAVIAALHHEKIEHHLERISLLQQERNDPGIAINVLFNKKESIYMVHRSEINGKCKKQVNLLMVVDGEKRHYTAIKAIIKIKWDNPARISLLHELFKWFSNIVSKR